MSKWAVFDVDGTLLPHTSMEKIFVIQAYKAGILPNKNIFFYLFSIIQGIFQKNFTDSTKSNKTYLKNLSVERIQIWSSQYLENKIWNKISLKGIEKLKKIASEFTTAFLCAERFPWRCHRRFIALRLVQDGWRVIHILDEERTWEPENIPTLFNPAI